jgi:outer membrane protein OmpA-like peptidoglycan-associated protein
MSVNILEMIMGAVTPDLVGKVAGMLGESPEATQKAMGGVLPAALGALINKGGTEQGADALITFARNANIDGKVVDNLGALLGGGPNTQGLAQTGGNMLGALFGDKLGGVAEMIGGFAGVKGNTVQSLLALVAPVLLGSVFKASPGGLDAKGLVGLLASQKDLIAKFLPPQLAGLANLIPGFPAPAAAAAAPAPAPAPAPQAAAPPPPPQPAAPAPAPKPAPAPAPAPQAAAPPPPPPKPAPAPEPRPTAAAAEPEKKKGGGLLWMLLGVAALAAAGFVGYRMLQPAPVAEQPMPAVVEAPPIAVPALPEMSAITLPGGAQLSLPKGSIGDSLAAFLAGADVAPKTFEFGDALNFVTGGTELTPESGLTVDALAAILNAFPTVEVTLEGHTDNIGDAAANKTLSLARADAVKAQLAAKGVAAARITTLGSGADKPKADNTTEEGRAANRRLELTVTKK